MTQQLVKIPVERLEKAIFLIRGEKVMLDRDWLSCTGGDSDAKSKCQAYLERFPPDFMFELTRDEIAGISQFVTSSSLKFSKRVTATRKASNGNNSRIVVMEVVITQNARLRTEEASPPQVSLSAMSQRAQTGIRLN